jgi:hypothetical protein
VEDTDGATKPARIDIFSFVLSVVKKNPSPPHVSFHFIEPKKYPKKFTEVAKKSAPFLHPLGLFAAHPPSGISAH